MAGSGLFSDQQGVNPAKTQAGKSGLPGEVGDLRRDVSLVLADVVALTVEEFTDPAAADVDAIKASFASAAAAQSFSGTDLDGAVGTGTMSPPRNITITTSTHADIDAVDVVITGLDINGATLTETVTLTDGGGATDVGAKAFASVTQVDIPAQSGTGGAIQIGFGALIGFSKKLKSRAGAPVVTYENEAGTVKAADALAGTYADAATGAPNGTVSPATAADGSNDYAYIYEYDPTA